MVSGHLPVGETKAGEPWSLRKAHLRRNVLVLGPYALVLLPVGRWHLRCVSGQTGYHALVC